MFRVAKEIEFCYGHRLLDYDGKCRFLHGHNGRALIVLEGETLDHRGMLMDFTDIKRAMTTWIETTLDHRLILNERDPYAAYFREQREPVLTIPENPTAENIARMIFRHAREQQFPVVEVSLWETSQSYASYAEPPVK
ncbi:MAG: 6-carboxytetrahydropterin synthase [Planctomycetaceae bacterium]|nr:6-carboxytetrahydropterin synthase [Planctomycetaceae bacterium]